MGRLAIPSDPQLSDRSVRIYQSIVTTIATVGYGDITPSTDIQRIYTIFVIMLGAGVYATVIGNIASILENIDLDKASQMKKWPKLTLF